MNLLNSIRCDLSQKDYLIWKWVPNQGNPSRQNQIRWGSNLRVRTGEVAAFFYSSGTGVLPVDFIEGPCDVHLETKNLPIIANILGIAYGGDSPFPAEVFFINRGQAPQIKWGVPYFSAFDPRFGDFPIPVAAHGTITFQISDLKRFVEIQRLENFHPDSLREQILPQIRASLKSNLVTLAAARGIPLVQIEGRVEEVSTILHPTISKLLEGFGVCLRNFVIEGIELNKESESYAKLMAVTRDQSIANIVTQGDLGRSAMTDSQKINTEHLKDALSIQRRQLEKRQELQTQTDFLQTHQINLQANVAKTAAESLGKMGSNGSGGGGGLGDLGTAAITLGVGGAVGNALGRQLAGTIQNSITPVATPSAHCPKCGTAVQPDSKFCIQCGSALQGVSSPQPVAVSQIIQMHVAHNRQLVGVLPLDEINRKLATGSLVGTDLCWKVGMSEWLQLQNMPGIITPPPIPDPETPPPIPQ